MKFHAGETVICKLEVRDESGTLVDPATSMKITITDYQNGEEVTDADMVKDGTGLYHYDWNTPATSPLGIYHISYTAIDGTRVSIEKDSVELVY